MIKRELFVFAGQSNMMGANVYAPKKHFEFNDSFEYLHKPKRFGEKTGDFKKTAFPVGEFSYVDLFKAYKKRFDTKEKSELADYGQNTFFCPAMSNLLDEKEHTVSPFSIYSEKTFQNGACLVPFVVKGWEDLGQRCAYAHIAKGGVSILHFFDEEMWSVLRESAKSIHLDIDKFVEKSDFGAGNYFQEKIADFFLDSNIKFSNDDLSTKVFFWLQGESDCYFPKELYKLCLKILWNKVQDLGFNYFFCIRVGFWGDAKILQVIRAQEEFCLENENVYMLTRAISMMPMFGQDIDSWFINQPIEKYLNCRDSFCGFDNQHINEKGFQVAAKKIVANMERILLQGKKPILEKENLKELK